MTGDEAAMGEMTLRDYATVVWRRKWYVIIAAVLTTVVATALSASQTPQYRASADVLVQLPPTRNTVGSTGMVMSQRLVDNELQTAAGSTLQSQVHELVGAEPQLSVTDSEGSDVFTFTATSSDAGLAATAANTYATEYITRQRTKLIDEFESRTTVLEAQLADLDDAATVGVDDAARRDDFQRELENIAVSTELARTGGSTLIDEATVPGSPFEPNTARTAMLALVVGLLIGLGAAFLVDYLDTSIRNEDDLLDASGLANLAVIPRVASTAHGLLVARDDPASAAAESFRDLRTSLKFLSLDRPIGVLLVTSARPGEGKTTTATNLATVAARSGQRVVLVDCDLRKPRAHEFLGLPNEHGFTSVLLGDATLQGAAQFPLDESNLAVVTSGPLPPEPSDLLSGDTARRVLERLRDEVGLVIVDSPPVLPVADASILAGLVDGVIVVASENSTDRRHLARAVRRLQQVEAPLLGTVLNCDESSDSADYTYGYERPAGASSGSTASTASTGASGASGVFGATRSTTSPGSIRSRVFEPATDAVPSEAVAP